VAPIITKKILSNCLEDIDLESGFISAGTMIRTAARTLTLKPKQMLKPAQLKTETEGGEKIFDIIDNDEK